jgi:hypothetical protein
MAFALPVLRIGPDEERGLVNQDAAAHAPDAGIKAVCIRVKDEVP